LPHTKRILFNSIFYGVGEDNSCLLAGSQKVFVYLPHLSKNFFRLMTLNNKITINFNKIIINFDKIIINFNKIIINFDKIIINFDKIIINFNKIIINLNKIIINFNKLLVESKLASQKF
jgi:hypothetical protein